MNGISNILIATDLSPEADQALGQAMFFAQTVKADVHLLHVMPGDESEGRAQVVQRVHERMESAAARHLDARLPSDLKRDLMVHTRVIRGMGVVPAVLTHAEQVDADLIVMGTRGRSSKERQPWQSHAEEIARSASCAVLTVGRHAWSMPGMIRRVLVPLSLTGNSSQAIYTARRLAHFNGAEIDLLHVVKPATLGSRHRSNGDDGRRRVEHEVMQKIEEAYRESGGPEVSHRVHIRYGEPVSAVVQFVRSRRSSLIVLTSRGATGIRYALQGSVAAAIIGKATCPVLTLKNNYVTGVVDEEVAAGDIRDR